MLRGSPQSTSIAVSPRDKLFAVACTSTCVGAESGTPRPAVIANLVACLLIRGPRTGIVGRGVLAGLALAARYPVEPVAELEGECADLPPHYGKALVCRRSVLLNEADR